jgi:hypothetical protein
MTTFKQIYINAVINEIYINSVINAVINDVTYVLTYSGLYLTN